jgi:hypothetical protein
VPDAVVAAVEAEILPRAAGLGLRALRQAIRAALLAHGVNLSDARREEAQRLATVRVAHERDGMSELRAFMPTASAVACADAVDRYARLLKTDGDPRPIGMLRALVLEDLILRPWDTSRPPVTAQLTITAPIGALRPQTPTGTAAAGAGDGAAGGGPAPIADLDGQPITAAVLRGLLDRLDATCPGGLQAPAGGSLHVSLVDPGTGRLRAVLTAAQLRALARAGCPTHPAGDCGCPLLDRPPPAGRYRPTAAQYRFIRTRDRRCRFPGCANKAGWSDADHVLPHACGGATACENLCCLCRRHHRLKTHARGWRFTMTDDGILTVTTPAGITRTTRPPGLTPPTDTPLPATTPPARNDDPPPF